MYKQILSYLLFLFLFFTSQFLNAQIVRIENNQAATDSSTFSGSIDLNMYTIRNNTRFFKLASGSQLKYTQRRHALLSINEVRFLFSEASNLENRGYQHFRYQRQLDSTITLEAFSQFQFDQVLRIKLRQLNGIGPRFRLFRKSSSPFFLGAHYMYEYEEEYDTGNINRDHRLSSHFTFSRKMKRSSIHCIAYYQPNMSNFDDYRVSGSSTFSIELRERLQFTIRAELAYDSKPVIGVNDLTYTFLNGLSLEF